MSGSNPNPVSGSAGDPVVTPADHKGRNIALALGVAGLIGFAGFAIYWMPEPETAQSQKERQDKSKVESERPGAPGSAFRKPGYEDVPRVEAMAEKPADPRPLAAPVRRRPQPSMVSTWNAPAVTAAPAVQPATAATAVTPAAANTEAKPQKIGGLPVMQAERIDDPSWFLFPGDQLMCRNLQPLTEKTGAFWTASIPEARLSRDGTRQLIPAGSEAFGKIVTGFQNGDRRLSAVITHISTPAVPGKPMLFIPIDMGQVGDDMGRVDMDGNVENDFWGRLASVGAYALLDAVARGGTSYASGQLNRTINGGNNDGVNVNVGNFGGISGQTLAGSEYQRQQSKPPVFNRPQAQTCSILITKPINLRNALSVAK